MRQPLSGCWEGEGKGGMAGSRLRRGSKEGEASDGRRPQQLMGVRPLALGCVFV